jgi:hypothetical protein
MNVEISGVTRRFGRNLAVAGVDVETGATGRPGARRMASLAAAGRLLRLELKRSAVPYVLPLLAAVFYFNTVRTADGFPPVWTLRASVIGDHMLFEFSAFAGGMAAWAGSRERRRKTLDLAGTTPRAAWARLSVTLAGTLGWLLLAFLAEVAVIYIHTALQATWGGPPLWPVFVGAAGVIAVTMIGFTCGAAFPRRFTAPLVAIGVLVLYQTGFREALGITPLSGTYALLSPANVPPSVDAGVYYHVAPDVPIMQVMFMGGIAIGLSGVLGVAAALRQPASADARTSLRAWLACGDGRLLRAVAVILVACGVAASWTAFALAGTAKPDAAGGWEVPALHSAASDQPVPVTQDCASGTGFGVCVHPAFSFYLDDVAAALGPVAAEIAGLPGAPTRAAEVASESGGKTVMSGISGNPPVFDFTAEQVGTMFGEFFGIPDAATWRAGFQQGLLDAFLTEQSQPAAGAAPAPFGAAQGAVEDALLAAVGSQPFPGSGASAGVSAATQRFAALSASARHAWLAVHLAALRAGTLRLAQIP